MTLRRTGFARPRYTPAPAAPLRRVERSGVIVRCSAAAQPVPKTEPKRNRALLDMARDEGCLLRVPGVCNGDRKTTVACHSNWAEHGKAGARKADDCYSVWGCSACHAWLDQGKAHHQEKRRVWDGAFAWQRDIWLQIISGLLDATPKERKAVEWALHQLTINKGSPDSRVERGMTMKSQKPDLRVERTTSDVQ